MAKPRTLNKEPLDKELARIARTQKKAPPEGKPGIVAPFAELGKYTSDPLVVAAFDKLGIGLVPKKRPTSAENKAAGFYFALERMPHDEEVNAPRIVAQLFLYPGGKSGYAQFVDLPAPFRFGTREALLTAVPTPFKVFKRGGKPVASEDPYSETWKLPPFLLTASYKNGWITYFDVKA